MSGVRVSLRFVVLAVMLIAMNLAGLLWIRAEINSRPIPRLRVLAFSPQRDYDTTDRISLVFDEALALPDRIGQPLAQSPFVIEPSPPGHWEYSGPQRLDYVLAEQLPPGRTFSVRPSPDFTAQLGRELVGDTEWKFSTRRLRVFDCRIDSADETHVNVVFEFNQPVSPIDLQRGLRITGEAGTSFDSTVQVLNTEPSETLTVRFAKPRDESFRVSIGTDVTGHDGMLGLAAAWSRKLTLPTRFAFIGSSVYGGRLNRPTTVTFRFNGGLDRDQDTPPLVWSPSITIEETSIRNNRMTVQANFKPGVKYSVILPATIASANGNTLAEQEIVSFQIPDLSPEIRFPISRGVLSPQGNLELAFESVNIDEIEFSRYSLHENNIVEHLRHGSKQATSRDIGSKTVRLDGLHNHSIEGVVDLNDLLGGSDEDPALGVYAIHARATNLWWSRAYATITVTDLAITTRSARDGILVWITSIHNGSPVADVSVSAYSYNNQVLSQAMTGLDGVAFLAIADNHPDGNPFVVTAKHDGDFSFIETGRSGPVSDNQVQVGRQIPRTYDVFLFSERGVYRPGDVIHLSGILREPNGTVPPSFPIELKIERPDGRMVETRITHPDNIQAVFHEEFQTLVDGQTGRYHITASLPGSDAVIGETSAWVEAFEPVRLEVDASPASDRVSQHEKASVTVDARYLFGQAAANLDVRVAGVYRVISHRSEQYPNFTFGNVRKNTRIHLSEQRAALDEHGHASIEIPWPKATVPTRAQLNVTVTELGGRSVSTFTEFILDPLDRHLGLYLPAGAVVPTNEDVELHWIAINASDTAIDNDSAVITLEFISHEWVLEEFNGRPTWKSVEQIEKIHEYDIAAQTVEERSGVEIIRCTRAGEYRITIREESGAASSLRFNASPYAASSQRLALTSAERLELVLDRKQYASGETAELLVRSPFPGTLLLTIESDRVQEHRIVEMTETAMRLELPVREAWRGSVSIAATLVRPVDPDQHDWLPHRATGFLQLAIDHSTQRRNLVIDAPARAYPGDTTQITVRSDVIVDPSRPPVVQFWAVDEGILLANNFATPDPFDHFLAMRRSTVGGADIYSDLLPDFKRAETLIRIGGDGGARRRNPVPARHKQAAVIWRGFAPLGPDGSVTINVPVPELQGTLRLMAVIVDGDTYGSCNRELTVAQDIIIESSWPRAIAPGDSFRVPVKLVNTLDHAVVISPTLVTTDNIHVDATLPDSYAMSAGQSKVYWITCLARNIGPVHATVAARYETEDGSRESAVSSDFTVRSISPLNSQWRFSRMAAGEADTLPAFDSITENGSVMTLSVAATPDVEMVGALSELIDYPYGCVEQTTSRLWALLHAPDVFALVGKSADSGEAIQDMIRAGVARLWSMQTRDGGLSYWPSGTTSTPWGSAYAAHFLVEAHRAGYDVDSSFATNLAKYLEQQLHANRHDLADANIQSLICRILISFNDIAGWTDSRQPSGWLTWLSEHIDQLDMAGRAHLAMAYLELGNHEEALAILNDDLLSLSIHSTTTGRLSTPARQYGVLLSALLELDPNHPLIAPLVLKLNDARTHGHWGTTLSNAIAISALSMYQATNPSNNMFAGTITAGEHTFEFDHSHPWSMRVQDFTGPITVTSNGTGQLYLTQMIEGLSTNPDLATYDRQLVVRREYFDEAGEPLDVSSIHVGDLVQVEITIALESLPDVTTVHNIAIVDLLPGGCEIEHPRLATSAGARKTRTTGADRTEFLDDRVIIFTSVSGAKRTYRYALRAVTEGEFELPQIQASCMYDPSFASLNGGGAILRIQR